MSVLRNDDKVEELWLDLLYFYGILLNITDYVVSIRQGEPLLKEEKKWPRKRIAIEGELK